MLSNCSCWHRSSPRRDSRTGGSARAEERAWPCPEISHPPRRRCSPETRSAGASGHRFVTDGARAVACRPNSLLREKAGTSWELLVHGCEARAHGHVIGAGARTLVRNARSRPRTKARSVSARPTLCESLPFSKSGTQARKSVRAASNARCLHGKRPLMAAPRRVRTAVNQTNSRAFVVATSGEELASVRFRSGSRPAEPR